MAELKTPLEYEKIICEQATLWVENFMSNIVNMFDVPNNVIEYVKNNPKYTNQAELEKLGVELDKTLIEWKPKDGNMEKSILINHFMSMLQNAVIILASLKINLEKEELPAGIARVSGAVDVIVGTAVQMYAVKADILTKQYKEIGLETDPNQVFLQSNKSMLKVLEQDAKEAFAHLIENIMIFTVNYQKMYATLSSQDSEDKLQPKRIELFMQYLDSYYLLSFMLILCLTYPVQNGLMQQEVFDSLCPKITIFN